MVAAGFRDLDVERIYASTHVANERARRLLEFSAPCTTGTSESYGMEMALYAFTR